MVDPVEILRAIASDPSAPATARVAACRALVCADKAADRPDNEADDAASRLALRILKGRRP
jgi:hypothetical protein